MTDILGYCVQEARIINIFLLWLWVSLKIWFENFTFQCCQLILSKTLKEKLFIPTFSTSLIPSFIRWKQTHVSWQSLRLTGQLPRLRRGAGGLEPLASGNRFIEWAVQRFRAVTIWIETRGGRAWEYGWGSAGLRRAARQVTKTLWNVGPAVRRPGIPVLTMHLNHPPLAVMGWRAEDVAVGCQKDTTQCAACPCCWWETLLFSHGPFSGFLSAPLGNRFAFPVQNWAVATAGPRSARTRCTLT